MSIGNCSICYENIKVAEFGILRNCPHGFHEHCIAHWLRTNNSCPSCREAAHVRDITKPIIDPPEMPVTVDQAIEASLDFYDRAVRGNAEAGERDQLKTMLTNVLSLLENRNMEDDPGWEEMKNFLKNASLFVMAAFLAYLCVIIWPLILPIAGKALSIFWSLLCAIWQLIRAHLPHLATIALAFLRPNSFIGK